MTKNTKKSKSRYYIPNVDEMRAEVSANTSSLANAANLSRSVVAEILEEIRKPKTSCERVVNGLKKLGHKEVNFNNIKEDSK